MPIPELDTNGNLPPGTHEATLEEVAQHYGTSSQRRIQIMYHLRTVIHRLEALGVVDIWVDGSFVTRKSRPHDADVVYDPPLKADYSNWGPLAPTDKARTALNKKHRIDLLPRTATGGGQARDPIVLFFQQDIDGNAKGIIKLTT